MSRRCIVRARNHSEDRTAVYRGRTEPDVLCGYHASRIMGGDTVEGMAEYPPPPRIGQPVRFWSDRVAGVPALGIVTAMSANRQKVTVAASHRTPGGTVVTWNARVNVGRIID